MLSPPRATISSLPGPQTEFLRTAADICIYGGAAGGGKTVGLILEPLRYVSQVPGFTAVFFRRTTPEITNPGGLWDESLNFYPRFGGIPHHRAHEWRWSRGGKIKFSHLQLDSTVYHWQGAQIALICFDELTHFTAHQFYYLLSRNRSTCGVRPYIRATCNPDADSWVADFLAWWIDQETGLPIPERAGVLRYFIRVAEKTVWADRPEELMHRMTNRQDRPPGGDLLRPISVTFIPANVHDNPVLLRINPEYLTWLLSLQLLERERLLGGNWKFGRRPGCILSGSGAPSSIRSRRIWRSCATGIWQPPRRLSSMTRIGPSASSSAAMTSVDTGCSMWCGYGRTRAMLKDCCSKPRPRMASGCGSVLARIRDRPVRAKHFIWCAR
jgi:hypothetical protein